MRDPSGSGQTAWIPVDGPGGVLKAGIFLFVADAALVSLFVGLMAVVDGVGRAVGEVVPFVPRWVAHVLFFVTLGVVILGFFAGVFVVLGRLHGPD